MTDIYAHITIIDTNAGKIIPRNRNGWELMAGDIRFNELTNLIN